MKNDAMISAAGEGIMEQLKGAMSGGGGSGHYGNVQWR